MLFEAEKVQTYKEKVYSSADFYKSEHDSYLIVIWPGEL